jgi:hemerythrin-like domain-containing protein
MVILPDDKQPVMSKSHAPTRTDDALGAADQQAALVEQLRIFDRQVAEASPQDLASIAELLNHMRSALRDHFHHEEHDGPFAVLLTEQPRFEHAIHRLIAEHRELEDSLEALIDMAATLAALDDGFKKKVESWIHRVRRHEMDEDDILPEAYGTDLGAAD